MSGYIGTAPVPQASQTRDVFTATAGQTSFATTGYTPSFLDVYVNGSHLKNGTDYTASNGSDVVMASGLTVGDYVEVVAFSTFTTSDTVSASSGGTFNGKVGIGTGSDTLTRELTIKKNDQCDVAIVAATNQSAQLLFGDTDADNRGIIEYNNSYDFMAFTVAGSERMRIDSSGNVGIGTTTPVAGTKLTLNDAAFGGMQFQSGGSDCGYIGVNTNTLYVGAGDKIAFHTGNAQATDGTERMRLDSSGRLLCGLTSAYTTSTAEFKKTGSGEPCVTVIKDGWAAGSLIQFVYGSSISGAVGSITTNGSTTAYNTSSDHRLKENVTDVTDGITRVKQLEPKRFNFIADPDTTVDGFLAHEAQLVVPEAVTGEKDEVDADGNAVMQGIDQAKLVPLLTAALQEAITKIETLETKVAALEAE